MKTPRDSLEKNNELKSNNKEGISANSSDIL